MTNLKIKEKINWNSGEALTREDFDSLKGGDMLYSYNYDMLIMVTESVENYFHLVNLTCGEIHFPEDEELFRDYADNVSEMYGPFYLVNKAKITFKVGE